MKGLLVLLCVFVAAQARSTAVQTSPTALAALGENPWVVHLRLAIATSGFLNSCAGSLIDERWVLTSDTCVSGARFIWVRYGVVTVINPELVTESSAVRANTNNNVALISIGRSVQSSANIRPIRLAREEYTGAARFCGFGESENGGAGEYLNCFDVVADSETFNGVGATRFDDGAALVNDGVQFGIVVGWPSEGDDNSAFRSTAGVINWIEAETGLQL